MIYVVLKPADSFSEAVYIHHLGYTIIRYAAWTSILPPLDLRGVWKRKLFLCHHTCLELGLVNGPS